MQSFNYFKYIMYIYLCYMQTIYVSEINLSWTKAATAQILLLSVHLKVFRVKEKPKFFHSFKCVSGYSLK